MAGLGLYSTFPWVLNSDTIAANTLIMGQTSDNISGHWLQFSLQEQSVVTLMFGDDVTLCNDVVGGLV